MLDEIERLKETGLTDEEAFVLAKHNLGTTKELVSEYEKVNHKMYVVNRINPYLKGMILYNLLTSFTGEFGKNLYLTLKTLEIAPKTSMIITYTLLFLVIGGIYGSAYRFLKKPNTKLKKLTTYPALLIAWCLTTIGGNLYYKYIMDMYFETNHSLYTDQDFVIPMVLLHFVFAVSIICASLWVYWVKRKNNKVVISS